MHLFTFSGTLCTLSICILAATALVQADVGIAAVSSNITEVPQAYAREIDAPEKTAKATDALLAIDVDTPHENQSGREARQFGGFGHRRRFGGGRFGGFGRFGGGRRFGGPFFGGGFGGRRFGGPFFGRGFGGPFFG